MHVISISRRTDIPAFYSEWLLNRLRAGFCHALNPWNNRVTRVSLRAEDCLALVFWTRDPAPLLPHLAWLTREGYRCYAHVTFTGYPRSLEPYAPPFAEAADAIACLAETIGPDFTLWRYDPILISTLTPADEHRRQFARIANRLQGSTRRCITSFASLYRRTRQRLERLTKQQPFSWTEPGTDEKQHLARDLAEIAGEHGMELCACCDPDLLGAGLAPSRCIDLSLIAQLQPDINLTLKASPSRPDCGCAAAIDIGVYDTCAFECACCYATGSLTRARHRRRAHDPGDTILYRPPALRDIELP